MKHKSIILATIAISILGNLFISCNKSSPMTATEEEATYMLVGGPCGEGDYATAISRADSLLNSPIQMSDTLKAYIMIDRDVALAESGQTDRAYTYADTLIQFGLKHDIPLAVMQGLQNQGIISRRGGDWDKAISLYKEGLEIAVETDDTEMQQVFAEMLSVACAEHELYDEAIVFGNQSLEMAKEMGDSIQQLNVVSTLSAIYTKQGEYSKAIAILLPYQSLSKEVRGVIKVKYLTPLLRSYIHLDSLQKSRQILGDMYASLEGMPHTTQAYLVTVNAEAMIAEKERRYSEQWHWLQTADSIGSMGSSADALYAERAKCLANLGRYKEAYEMQEKAYLALDSSMSAKNEKQLSELMVKYDTLRKDNDIANLKAQRLKWTILAIGCLLTLAIIIILSIYASRKAKLRLERERREEYIRGLENERRRIARELHDDIAGSLVGLQFKLRASSPDEFEKELIRLNRRIRTMSHEMMPPEFSNKSFLEILHDYEARINGHNEVHSICLTHSGSFDWDSLSQKESLELYRMIQELVSNAMRHGSDGEISIILSGDELWKISVESYLPQDAIENMGKDGIGNRTLNERSGIIGASVEVKILDNKYIVILKKNL